LLVDDDLLIDAGTGVMDLALHQLARIDHIFLTHAHMDHIASIPFMVDAVHAMRDQPLTVHALPETIEALHAHIFNWQIWPDFSKLPTPEAPALRFEPIELGQTVTVRDRHLTALPAAHTVPAVGYRLDGIGGSSLAFSGDTGPHPAFWHEVNRIETLKTIIIETAFPDHEAILADASKHMCPSMLVDQLAMLERPAEVWITHLKPGDIELTMDEILRDAAHWKPRMLQVGQILTF
jgi:cAMP phosphodiesterase